MTLAVPAKVNSSGTGYTSVTGSAKASYGYNSSGQLSSILTGLSGYSFSYDIFGNTSSVGWESASIASYTYNPGNGKLASMTYASGVTVSYVYDELDRVKEICYAYSGGDPITAYEYTYDANGYLHKFTDRVSGQVTVYKYTQSGRLREYYVNDLDSSKKSQTGVYNEYDSEGRISSQFFARDCLVSGEIDEIWWESGYRYNDDGTLAGFTTSFDEARYDGHYTYDDLGRLTGDSVGLRTTLISSAPAGTVSSSYTYSSNGASTSLRISGVSTSYTYGTTVSDTENRSYTYNSAGYITHIYKNGVLQYSYAYDDLGQLTRENNLPANRTYLYSYDKDGNILSKTECYYSLAVANPIGTTSFTYDGTKSDCLTKITFPDGKVFSTYYSSIGNPAHIITENGDTMAAMWSMGRRLTTIAAGLNTFYYSYNADGIRTTKTVNGVKHTYALSGTMILNEEWTENGVQHLLMYVYDANGSPVGMVYRNSTMAADATEEYLFVKNIQGDILHVYNSTGNKLVSYVYDAWGNIISTTYSNGGGTSAARFNPFTYRGYYRDSETGMYYLNSRYYNPKMGRFISADAYVSTGQGLLGYNMYAYCGNNPVNRIDSEGEFWWAVILATVVFAAILTSCENQNESLEGTPADPKARRSFDTYDEALNTMIKETSDKAYEAGHSWEFGAAIFQYPGDDRYYTNGARSGEYRDGIDYTKCYPSGEEGVVLVAFIHSHLWDYVAKSTPFNVSDLRYGDQTPDRYVLYKEHVYRLAPGETDWYKGWTIYR